MVFQHLTSGFSTAEHPCKAEMIELADALAADRALPQQPGQRVQDAIASLRKSGGEHTLLDAAAVASFFSTFTIVVDSTGQKNVAFDIAAPLFSGVVKFKRKAARMLPVLGAVAVVAAAAYIATSRRLM